MIKTKKIIEQVQIKCLDSDLEGQSYVHNIKPSIKCKLYKYKHKICQISIDPPHNKVALPLIWCNSFHLTPQFSEWLYRK